MKNPLFTLLALTVIISILFIPMASGQNTNSQFACLGAAKEFAAIRAPFRGLFDFDDYFEDYFDRSACHLADVDNVRADLTNQNALLRQDLFTCQEKGTIEKDRKEMYRLEAELFYTRHFMDTDTDIPIPNLSIRQELVDRFVHKLNLMDEQTTNVYVDEFEIKYKDRGKKYLNCKDDVSWQDLKKKAIEFKENLNIFRTAQDEWKSQEKKRAEEKEEKKKLGVKEGLGQNFINHHRKNVSFEINKVPPKRAKDELVKEFKKQHPGVSDPSLSKISELVQEEQIRFEFFIDSAEKRGRYKTLYALGGDEISEELVNKLTDINGVIRDTYLNILPYFLTCVETVNEKQCT